MDLSLMDSVEMSCNGECIDEAAAELLLPSNLYDVFGEPEIIPRVGDEYQVETPRMMSKSDYLLLQKDPTEEEALAGGPLGFLMGLPLSIMWIKGGVENFKHDDDAHTKRVSVKPGTDVGVEHNDLKVKIEPMDVNLVGELRKSMSREEVQMQMKDGTKSCFPVPGSLKNCLSKTEESSFVLGLYIFGKNLVQVRKFLESEDMGDVMAHYYGKFYGSLVYRRWSECRKMKSRRCIFGQKIFAGLRQQEFLSRLLPQVSVENQSRLLEVSRAFGEGRISLEEYVFTLKAAVGLDKLVEAIGIGQGKRDLTGLVAEPLKSNQAIPACPEIPIGKACSRLTTAQIVDFLTGGFRLSKARSNDLFWEAVWPRLLARGWHSEQPENGCVTGSRNALVFLVPGVKKFSKRRLVKGNHYFDSVSDVLSKVASEPGLLDLEVTEGYGAKGEEGWANEPKSEDEDSADEERHCYLKPRTPSRSTDGMKFTVVDTSMANGDARKLRELRSLPPEINVPSLRGYPEEDDGNICGEPINQSGSADSLSFSTDETDICKPVKSTASKKVSSERNYENIASSWGSADTLRDAVDTSAKIRGGQKKNISKGSRLGKAAKCEQKLKVRPKNRTRPAGAEKKPRKSSFCNLSETSCNIANFSANSRFKQEEASSCSSNPNGAEKMLLTPDPSPEVFPFTSLPLSHPNGAEKMHLTPDPSPEVFPFTNLPPKGNQVVLSSCDHANSQLGFGVSHENFQPGQELIDLNLPVQPDAEFSDNGIMANSQNDMNASNTTSSCVANPEQQPHNMNSRRQSTRNRPLTTKALEALAFGLMDTKKKRRTRDEFSADMMPRPSRRLAGRAQVDENKTTPPVSLSPEEHRKDDLGGNTNDNL
ncbi:uncharacterized protein LOC115682900 isoform X1 [Syzygium oleosum]|uniref:uncharacterized protein LOC115682900 isoform X1 n=2 Tax=Syzygium oleosum TaxID=219896 RepID=UPI0024BA4A90|nr:uncharacterized protein LOC115682900 isoform X1 [Syzygium oleosum]